MIRSCALLLAIIAALKAQADRVTLTSRAFHNDRMGDFLEKLCRYTGFGMALPMNTGAEAVEMAKRFGAADSPSFVNGVLDAIRGTVRGARR